MSKWTELLSCQPRVTVRLCFVYNCLVEVDILMSFIYIHTLYLKVEKTLASVHLRRLTWAFVARPYDKYQNLIRWLIWYCKALIFGRLFYLALLAVKTEIVKIWDREIHFEMNSVTQYAINVHTPLLYWYLHCQKKLFQQTIECVST